MSGSVQLARPGAACGTWLSAPRDERGALGNIRESTPEPPAGVPYAKPASMRGVLRGVRDSIRAAVPIGAVCARAVPPPSAACAPCAAWHVSSGTGVAARALGPGAHLAIP